MQTPPPVPRCNAIPPSAPKKHRKTNNSHYVFQGDINVRRFIYLCPSARAMQAALDFVASVSDLPIRNEGGDSRNRH
jgi:hypothetical protein